MVETIVKNILNIKTFSSNNIIVIISPSTIYPNVKPTVSSRSWFLEDY